MDQQRALHMTQEIVTHAHRQPPSIVGTSASTKRVPPRPQHLAWAASRKGYAAIFGLAASIWKGV